MTHEEIDKWVEDHAQFHGDWTDEKSVQKKQAILEWAKMIAHKFYELGRQSVAEDRKKEAELPRFYGD